MQETQDNKKAIIGVVVGVIIIALLFLAANFFSSKSGENNDGQNATSTGSVESDSSLKTAFLCDDGFTMDAVFTEEQVVLNLSDKRVFTLAQVDAALGARFQNADNSIALIVLGPSASFEENGKITHADCVQPKG